MHSRWWRYWQDTPKNARDIPRLKFQPREELIAPDLEKLRK